MGLPLMRLHEGTSLFGTRTSFVRLLHWPAKRAQDPIGLVENREALARPTFLQGAVGLVTFLVNEIKCASAQLCEQPERRVMQLECWTK